MPDRRILLGALFVSACLIALGIWGIVQLADHFAALFLIIPLIIPLFVFGISLRYLISDEE